MMKCGTFGSYGSGVMPIDEVDARPDAVVTFK